MNKLLRYLIVIAVTALFVSVSFKSLSILLDLKKDRMESRRVIVKECDLDRRWYDTITDTYHRRDNRTWIEFFFSKVHQVSRYKMFYDSDQGYDHIRLLLGKENHSILKLYLFDLDYLRKNEKVKRSRKRADHELIFDVKYYKHSKIVCEIKPVKGSEYEKEDEEFLKNILRLN